MVTSSPDSHHLPGLRLVRLPVRPAWLGVILIGGAGGSALRAWLETTLPPAAGHWPWTTWCINVSGALMLGVLLEVLAVSGPDEGWRRGVRLGVGTGALGGYTTYSTFAVETVQLLQGGALLLALGYALGSVLTGVLAAVGGAYAVRRLLRGHRRARGALR